jgi:hypothetical protein
LNEARDALRVFAGQPNLAAFEVAGYNPDLDADGQGARKLVDLLADALSARLEIASAAAAGAGDVASTASTLDPPIPEAAPSAEDSTAGAADPFQSDTSSS